MPRRHVDHVPTPFYRAIPRWGLLDPPPTSGDDAAGQTDRGSLTAASLTKTLLLVASMLAAAAGVHLLRYLIVVVNRSTPIPLWLDLLSGAAVLVFGAFAVVGMLIALVALVRWLLSVRAQAYAAAGTGDPRSRFNQVLLAALPLVNVIGAPLLLAEVAGRDGTSAAEALARIRRLAIAWGLVNAAALVAVAYRIGGWFSDSVQVHADGLVAVTFSLAVSAVFARWAAPRLTTVLTGPVEHPDSERRWVAV